LFLALMSVVPVVLSAGAQTSERPTDDQTVPFLAQRPGAIVVPVLVGGAGPYRFLVDTGSTHTAVRDTFAASIGAAPVARTVLTTSTGNADALVVRLARVAIGPAAVDELLATSLTTTAAGVLGDDVDGVIGQDFLSRFDYTLDYVRSRLIWERDLDGRPGTRVALVPAAGRFVIEVPRASGEPALRLVPDSGTDALVLFERPASPGVAEAGSAVFELTSMTGRVSVRTARLRSMRVGDAWICDPLAGIVPAPSVDEDTAADGLLPLDLFASVSVNNHRRYMVVRPRVR
jgi:hypothetical protein